MNIECVSSARLDQHGLSIVPGGHLPFGQRMINISDVAIALTDEHVEQIAVAATSAVRNMSAEEPTLARSHGLPTLLSRVDCTIVDGKVMAYEVEDRPAGIFVSHKLLTRARQTLLPAVHRHFKDTVGELPTVVHYPSLAENDDGRHLTVVAPDDRPSDGPLLVRSKLQDQDMRADYHELVGRSVTPILTEGDKSYRLNTGDAVIASADYELDPTQAVVIKAKQCTRANGIGIYLPPAKAAQYGMQGVLTAREATRLLEKHAPSGDVLIEPYLEPIPTAIGKQFGATILRVFVSHDPSGEVSVLGGGYVSRPAALVHGEADAYAGPVTIP